MKQTIVIVGGVATGASAAARLRRLDEESTIILLEKDEYISFANCGLPYYIGNVIKDRAELIVETKESMKERYNIDVRNYNEAIKIDRDEKKLHVHDKAKNENYIIKYDKLVLAPGASPISPNFKNVETASNIFKIRNIPDVDSIKEYIREHEVKDVLVVGAGFIGLEMAENLNELGLNVVVADLASQVLNVIDKDMSDYVYNVMSSKGITFKLETSIDEILENGKKVKLTNDEIVNSDMIFLAIGVKPNTKLAVDANLEIGETGAIKVNEYLQTSDKDIYAGGDAIEVTNYVSERPAIIPLAGPANRQGRLIADNIYDYNTKHDATLGTSIIKIFDYAIGFTGLSEKVALNLGYNAKSVHIHRPDHASYYPGSTMLTIKLVFDMDTRKVLGAQAFGNESVDKRIDVIATSIKFGATVDQLSALELSYAPPFSSAKDPVNIAGYVASNVLNKDYKVYHLEDLNNLVKNNAQLIDVRSKLEFDEDRIDGYKNVPLDELRDNLDLIDFNRDVYLTCKVGHRGYVAVKILRNNGFKKDIYNLSGGCKLYNDTKR